MLQNVKLHASIFLTIRTWDHKFMCNWILSCVLSDKNNRNAFYYASQVLYVTQDSAILPHTRDFTCM